MSRFGLFDFRRNRYALTFNADDTLAAKRHVQFLLSQPSTAVAKSPRRYGLAMFIDLPPELVEGLTVNVDAAAFVVDVADLVGRDPSTVGYDVGPSYRSFTDPIDKPRDRGALH